MYMIGLTFIQGLTPFIHTTISHTPTLVHVHLEPIHKQSHSSGIHMLSMHTNVFTLTRLAGLRHCHTKPRMVDFIWYDTDLKIYQYSIYLIEAPDT